MCYQHVMEWTDGSAVSYVNWRLGEPNGDGPCVEMYPDDCAWNDINCDYINYSICKYNRLL